MTRVHVAALEGFTAHTSPTTDADRHAADDLVALGRRLRHHRARAGWTLADLAARVGSSASALSLVENGRREPRLSLLHELAGALDVPVTDLVEPGPPPTRRDALEMELDRVQRSPLFASLGLPSVHPGPRVPTEALEAIVGLHGELARRERAASATPEEARRANTELRHLVQRHDNHLPEIEELAQDAVLAAGHTVGALTHTTVARMASTLGFSIVHVDDLPHSTRTVTDLAAGRIYLPPASIPGGHGLRSLALQAIAHRVLRHELPDSYADFLRQRLEIAYFAAACLVPQSAAVAFLRDAAARRDLAVEDFRDAFGVTHEAAAQRLTNLATVHLGIPLHFLRVGGEGMLQRAYANDDLPLPTGADGVVEGQPVCRRWTARSVLGESLRTTENYQYTDTPAGTYLCSTQTATTPTSDYSVTVGVPLAHAKHFRGRDTRVRATSTCPDPACCRRPDPGSAARWSARAWPSARLHAHVLAPLPGGSFPGVDDREVYDFLEAHSG